jgi:UDP-3-O-[3-hydroxymyristoyl] N-acetylglucosamine deacetylase
LPLREINKLPKQSQEFWQRSLSSETTITGVGLHSGQKVFMKLVPAPANSGITVIRKDLPTGNNTISLNPHNVFDTKLATRLGSPNCSISTVEHFMAAAYALGVDNLNIEINSPEFPILDGSSLPFLVAMTAAGICELAQPKKVFVVRKTIEVVDQNNPMRFIRIQPSKTPKISYSIDFSKLTPHIGVQHLNMPLTGEAFLEQLSYARTFCLQEEIDFMRSRGLALGGSLENAIVVNRQNGIVNSRGLRNNLEFVRHKMLDCVGDLALVGMPILGEIIAHCAGHDLHTMLAKKVYELKDEQKTSLGLSTLFGNPHLGPVFNFPFAFTESRLNKNSLVSG